MIQGPEAGNGGRGTEPTFSASKAERPQPLTHRKDLDNLDRRERGLDKRLFPDEGVVGRFRGVGASVAG
jgi:hypothetical protein